MTRKHFRAIAEAISTIRYNQDRMNVAKLIGDVCAESNERFNRSTWYAACECDPNRDLRGED